MTFLAYKTIGEAIRKAVPEIRWIDLDKGQLDSPDQFHSIITPGVLIGNSEIEWAATGGGFRQGDGTISVKLVVLLPSETHLTDPLLSESLNALALAEPVQTAVLSVPGVIDLEKSSDYPSGSYYVVERTFTVSFISGPNYVKKNVQVQINPFLYKPATS